MKGEAEEEEEVATYPPRRGRLNTRDRRQKCIRMEK